MVKTEPGPTTFTDWYNHEHRHTCMGLYTLASVQYGTAQELRDQPQFGLNAAYVADPERFKCRPQRLKLPHRATIKHPVKRT